MARNRVRITDNGPMLMDGPVDILMPDGSVVHSERFVVALCLCKRSKNYPLCDASHRRKTAVPAAVSSQWPKERGFTAGPCAQK